MSIKNNYRDKSVSILNSYVLNKLSVGLDDLPDTPSVMCIIDGIEETLESFKVDCNIDFRYMRKDIKKAVLSQLHNFDVDSLLFG